MSEKESVVLKAKTESAPKVGDHVFIEMSDGSRCKAVLMEFSPKEAVVFMEENYPEHEYEEGEVVKILFDVVH